MRFTNISNARKNLADLVSAPDRTVVTREGEPTAVLLPIADYRSLVTAHALANDPQDLSRAMAAHRRVQRGDLSDTETVSAAPAEKPATPPARSAVASGS